MLGPANLVTLVCEFRKFEFRVGDASAHDNWSVVLSFFKLRKYTYALYAICPSRDKDIL